MRRPYKILLSVFVLALLFGRVQHLRNTAAYGVELLLPVEAETVKKIGTLRLLRLRYQPLIPPSAVSESGGRILVVKGIGSVASFAGIYDSKVPLRPQEYVLRYRVAFGASPSVRFGAVWVNIPKGFKAEKAAFAVLKADKNGNTVLTGLADGNGAVLLRK